MALLVEVERRLAALPPADGPSGPPTPQEVPRIGDARRRRESR